MHKTRRHLHSESDASQFCRLALLPTDLVDLVARLATEPTRCALSSSCRQLREVLSRLPVTHAMLRTSVVFRRPFTVSVHAASDMERMRMILASQRFAALRRLHVVVDSPAFLPGGRAPLRRTSRMPRRDLKCLRISMPLCRRFASLQLSASVVANLISPWTNLTNLLLEDCPNLCKEHLLAMRGTSVRVLTLENCRCTPSLRAELANGAIDGRLFPPTASSLHLGLEDLPNILRRCVDPLRASPLLLSAMPQLMSLSLNPATEAYLMNELWYYAMALQNLRTLQQYHCTTHVGFCMSGALSLVCQFPARFFWGRWTWDANGVAVASS